MVCRSTVDCSDSPHDELGFMSAKECCVDTPNSLAYSIPGTETCTACIGECMKLIMRYQLLVSINCGDQALLFPLCQLNIVFGFFNDSFTGVEQGPGHIVQAGYQKGAAQAGLNLVFDVMDTPGTASEFTLKCFCLV